MESSSENSPWRGDVFETGPHHGRLWATRHPSKEAPNGWAYKKGPFSNARRALLTGHGEPFVGVKAIAGKAAEQFHPASAFGPFRGWKRLVGQYNTSTPGNLNLKTGKFLEATPRQVSLRKRDSRRSHGLDGAAMGIGAILGTTHSVASEDVPRQ